MKHYPRNLDFCLLSVGICVLGSIQMQAQQTTTSKSAEAQNLKEPEEIIELSPFEVIADPRDSYEATNTNSISGVNVPLSQVPITADVYNRALMDDLGITDISRLLIDIAGIGPGVSGAGSDARGYLDGDNTSFGNFRARGLSMGAPARDGFLRTSGAQLDSFSLERTEVIRGPQSLLYGSSVGSGVINLTSKRAALNNVRGFVSGAFDDEGTYRVLTDLNVGKSWFGVRAVGVREERLFWRENLERDVKGGYLSVMLRPMQNLTIRSDYQRLHRRDVFNNIPFTFAAPGGASDPRNGKQLSLLVAQGNAGGILNDKLDFSNLGSLGGDWSGRDHDDRYYSISAEWVIRKGLALQVRFADDNWSSPNGNYGALQPLTSPSAAVNPTGKWAIGYQPQGQRFLQTQRGGRALLTWDFVTKAVEHRLIVGADRRKSVEDFRLQQFYLVGADGNFVVNSAQINNATAGRTLIPVQWYSVEGDFNGLFGFPREEIVLANGSRYRLADARMNGVVAPTDSNPLGINGGPVNVTLNNTDQEAYFGALFSDWFDGKVHTLAGLRWDQYDRDLVATGQRQGPLSGYSGNLGAVVPIHGGISLYYGYSRSFSVPTSIQLTYDGKPLPEARSVGHEAGVKIDWMDGRVSGSISAYRTEAQNENAAVPDRDAIDPAGLNGRSGGSTSVLYPYDLMAQGIEVSLTARPTRGWNIRFGYQKADGKNKSSVHLPILYNDEFNTDGTTVKIGSPTGSSLLVRQIPGNNSSPLVPLTLAMLKDPNSGYFAQLDPVSGQILNTAALGLTTSGVPTGRAGLPISSHQLGFQPASGGTLEVAEAGTKTTGYPADTFSLINSYAIQGGRFKGVSLGVSFTYQMNWRGYYYTDAPSGTRNLFKFPDLTQTRVWIGYERRIWGKTRFKTQLGIGNVFNDGDIVIQPAIATGAAASARLTAAPRSITWTNTVSF